MGLRPSDTVPVRYIELSCNVTFERFVDAAKLVDDPIGINKAAKDHDVTFDYDQVARLMADNGLTSVTGSAVTLPDLDPFNM